MTTTLRPAPHPGAPAGPGPAPPGSAEAGWYAICANGRPIGRVHITSDGPWGPGIGWIDHIEVLASRRRRGHGCVAMLAAEEILRAQRCTRVVADVPEGAPAGARLALSLGYAADSRLLVARVPGGADAPVRRPVPPAGAELLPMGPDEHAAWRDDAAAREIALLRGAGWQEAEARTRVAARLGGPAKDAFALCVGGRRAAALWLDLGGPVPGRADILVIEVDPAHRGNGHGGYLLRLAQHLAYGAGLGEVGIELVDPAPAARRLCAAEGYRTVSRQFAKMIL